MEVDRDRYCWRIGSGQAGGKDSSSDISGDLTHTDIEAEMGVLSLGDADGVVKGGGKVGSAGDDVLQVLGGVGFLGETDGRDDGSFEGARKWDAEAAEKTAGEASALTSDAEDSAIGEFEAEVEQEG